MGIIILVFPVFRFAFSKFDWLVADLELILVHLQFLYSGQLQTLTIIDFIVAIC